MVAFFNEAMRMIKYSEKSETEVKRLRELLLNHPHHFIRRKALSQLLHHYGVRHKIIEDIIDVCENTLRSYCCAYEENGIDSITTINFRKPKSQLVQFDDVVVDYLKKTPPASIKQACAEIGDLTGVHRHESQMRSYLRKIGARCRQVCGIPAKANIAKQKEFKEKVLDPRLKEAEVGLREVYFVDAAHFVLQGFLGKVWSLTRVFVRTPSGRQRWNVLGALNAITKKVTTITNDTYITASEVCQLLKRVAQDNIKSYEKTHNVIKLPQETQQIESNSKDAVSAKSIVVNPELEDEMHSEQIRSEAQKSDAENIEDQKMVVTNFINNSESQSKICSEGISPIKKPKMKPVKQAIKTNQEVLPKQEIIPSNQMKRKKEEKDKETIQKKREAAIRANAKKEAQGMKVMTPVTFFMDNAKYQRCLMVIALAEELGIEIEFLPPYSPNLNLIERLWKFTKKSVLKSKYYSSFDPFYNAINNFLENMIITHVEELESLLTLEFQTFTEEQINEAI
jgi:transposase